jgi:RNA polymerase sigma-70 factor (ECF subfamily)
MKYRKRRPNHLSLEQSQNPEFEGETIELQDWSRQPLQELLDAETYAVMEEGLRRLPEGPRTVFVLRDLEELSNAEVAEILGVTVATVKSRLHRARILLRDWMNRYLAGRTSTREMKLA